jgi:hypothetical protein
MLALNGLYNNMVRRFTTTTSDEAFKVDFVAAVNNAVDELSTAANLSAAIGHVVSPTDNISELDSDDQVIMDAGCQNWLILMGWPHRANDDNFFSLVARPQWLDAQGNYNVKKSFDDQADRSDSGVPLNDIVALGNVSGEGNSGEQ